MNQQPSPKKRIIITGGSGKVGQHIINHLLTQNYQILNLDLIALPAPLSSKVHTLKVDLTSSGQVYSAIKSHFVHHEPFIDKPTDRIDAIIHLAAYPHPLIVPDNLTFTSNVTSTYNVLEASCNLGIRKIILASSICAYGVTYAQGDVDFARFPVDEDTDVTPTDPYGLSKVCGETLGRGFAGKFGVDVYALRIGRVIAPDEYAEWFEKYVTRPEEWKVHGWSYVDVRDLARMVCRAVETDGLGWQVFNAVNDGITNEERDVEAFLARVCPGVKVTREFEVGEAPVCNRKIRRLLGFREEHPWRNYYSPGGRVGES